MQSRDMPIDVYTRWQSELKLHPMVNNFTQRRLIAVPVTPGRAHIPLEDIFNGLGLPSRMVICLASSRQVEGSYDTNPYYFPRIFGNATLTKTDVTLDGHMVDGFNLETGNLRLLSFLEYKRLQMFTGQANSATFNCGINYWAFAGHGLLLLLLLFVDANKTTC